MQTEFQASIRDMKLSTINPRVWKKTLEYAIPLIPVTTVANQKPRLSPHLSVQAG